MDEDKLLRALPHLLFIGAVFFIGIIMMFYPILMYTIGINSKYCVSGTNQTNPIIRVFGFIPVDIDCTRVLCNHRRETIHDDYQKRLCEIYSGCCKGDDE